MVSHSNVTLWVYGKYYGTLPTFSTWIKCRLGRRVKIYWYKPTMIKNRRNIYLLVKYGISLLNLPYVHIRIIVILDEENVSALTGITLQTSKERKEKICSKSTKYTKVLS